MQQLEILAYEAKFVRAQTQIFYQVGDLENLSATALYYGNSGSAFGGNGFSGIGKGEMTKFKIVATPLMKVETPKVGMTLSGGLIIKDLTKNSAMFQQDFGGVGNIYSLHPDGHGALRFYGNEIVNGKKTGKDRESKQSSW